MKVCQSCGAQNNETNNFCEKCSAGLNGQQAAPAKKKKAIYTKWWFWVVTVIVVASLATAGSGKDDNSASSPSAEPTVSAEASIPPSPTITETSAAPAEPKGINADTFEAAIAIFVTNVNSEDSGLGEISAKVTVNGSSAHVDIYFSDLSAWSNSNETDKKEFVNTMGSAMDTIAVNNVYSSDDTVGVTTTIYSPSGLKLAERTLFGKVKLY